jgi:hypothetical protein
MSNKNEYAIFKHKALLVCVNDTVSEKSNAKEVYEGTRYAWNVKIDRALQAQIVLAVLHGNIVGVFVPTRWLEATAENFPGREPNRGRHGFIGKVADKDTCALYLNKRLSRAHKLFGPIRYIGY